MHECVRCVWQRGKEKRRPTRELLWTKHTENNIQTHCLPGQAQFSRLRSLSFRISRRLTLLPVMWEFHLSRSPVLTTRTYTMSSHTLCVKYIDWAWNRFLRPATAFVITHQSKQRFSIPLSDYKANAFAQCSTLHAMLMQMLRIHAGVESAIFAQRAVPKSLLQSQNFCHACARTEIQSTRKLFIASSIKRYSNGTFFSGGVFETSGADINLILFIAQISLNIEYFFNIFLESSGVIYQ